MTPAALALLLLAARPASANVEPPDVAQAEAPSDTETINVPPLSMRMTNEDAEAGIHLRYHPKRGLTVAPSLRGGALAPTGAIPGPYSTLSPSPYASGDLEVSYTGPAEALGIGTVGYANIRSHKGIVDYQGTAASPASSKPGQESFSQNWMTYSGYLDAGRVQKITKDVKAAFFVAAGGFGLTSMSVAPSATYYTEGTLDGNVGTLWMMRKGKNDYTMIGDLKLESAPKNMFRNGDYTAVPSGLVSFEYAHRFGAKRLALGAEGTASRADLALRPYVEVDDDEKRIQALVAGNFRDSQNAFFPSVAGAGLELKGRLKPGVDVSVVGSVNREAFPLAPAPLLAYSVMANLTVSDGELVSASSGFRVRGGGRQPDDLVERSRDMNAQLPAAGYGPIWGAAFTQADSYGKFIAVIPVNGTDGILSALSVFTSSFNAMNYNSNEGHPPNADNLNDIYNAARNSYLTGTQNPVLVCIGSSQFAADLAEDLGRKAGIRIAASAVTVVVPDEKGSMAGHAAAAVITPQYGIVFVDWGKLTPTGTFDIRQALAVYQALVGIPEVRHEITGGREGHLIGYAYSEDGKVIARNLTFYNDALTGPLPRVFDDDPDHSQITLQHYRDAVRRAFDEEEHPPPPPKRPVDPDEPKDPE